MQLSEIHGAGRVNPFLANVPILYSYKTTENQRFSGCFQGYKMGTLARKGLISEFLRDHPFEMNAKFFKKSSISCPRFTSKSPWILRINVWCT